MDLVLYRTVGNLKRVALGDLATAEFYHADVNEKGVITLMPVNIVDGVTKRGTSDVPEETPAASAGAKDTADQDAPWPGH